MGGPDDEDGPWSADVKSFHSTGVAKFLHLRNVEGTATLVTVSGHGRVVGAAQGGVHVVGQGAAAGRHNGI